MSFNAKKFFTRLAVVSVFASISCFPTSPAIAAGKTPLRVGDNPPRITLSDLNGSSVHIPDDFRGKVIILHFWAGGCSSCKEEMPAMEKYYGKYARKGLVILAVNVGQRKESVKGLVKGMGITYPVLLDPDRKVAGLYDVVGVPRTYMVDRKGVIRYKILGSASDEMLKKQILSLL